MNKVLTDVAVEKDQNCTWVQCENPHCMKWRKLPGVAASTLSNGSWFCHMNPDGQRNFCEADEERMIVPHGLVVVCSDLDNGEVVWAKIQGYPRWPAVICPDPCDPELNYIERYQDGTGQAKYYHVEFLGSPHSHAWVLARHTEVYNRTRADLAFDTKGTSKALKVRYEAALREASMFMRMSHNERLHRCVYTCVSNQAYEDLSEKKANAQSSMNKANPEKKATAAVFQSTRPMADFGLSKSRMGVTEPTNNLDQHSLVQQVFELNQGAEASTSLERLKLQKAVTGNAPNPVSGKENSLLAARSGKHSWSEEVLAKNNVVLVNVCGKVMPILVPVDVSMVSTSSHCNAMQPLAECSTGKNAGAGIKVTSFLRNSKSSLTRHLNVDDMIHGESEFWKVLHEYCDMLDVDKDRIEIRWFNKRIDLFRFYKLVQEMGGFQAVSRDSKAWSRICREVIGSDADSQFESVKRAYRKLFLPFERYVKEVVAPFRVDLTSSANSVLNASSNVTSIPEPPPRLRTASSACQPSTNVRQVVGDTKGVQKRARTSRGDLSPVFNPQFRFVSKVRMENSEPEPTYLSFDDQEIIALKGLGYFSYPWQRKDATADGFSDAVHSSNPDSLQGSNPDSLPSSNSDSLPSSNPDSLPSSNPDSLPSSNASSKGSSCETSSAAALELSSSVIPSPALSSYSDFGLDFAIEEMEGLEKELAVMAESTCFHQSKDFTLSEDSQLSDDGSICLFDEPFDGSQAPCESLGADDFMDILGDRSLDDALAEATDGRFFEMPL